MVVLSCSKSARLKFIGDHRTSRRNRGEIR
jgi:hypothetical protein